MGTTLGGATTGLGLALVSGLASALPLGWRAGIALVVAVALVLLDLVQRRLTLPQRETLIPQEVFAGGMLRGIAWFGYEYGSGVRTLIPSAASYIVAFALVMVNLPWWQTVALAAVFGFARSWAAGLALAFSPGGGWSLFLGRHSRLLERLGSVVAGALVVVAVVLLAGWRG
ncbi:MAG TPA: hypothetical protein GXZ45_08290 [Propionibacterium sp.]|nr:hypothetical protein [Propionibacterium sp.]